MNITNDKDIESRIIHSQFHSMQIDSSEQAT